jgi:hypothetical protein
MKFAAAVGVHLAMGVAIGGGVLLLASKGQWWLLLLGAVGYGAGLYKYGCHSH